MEVGIERDNDGTPIQSTSSVPGHISDEEGWTTLPFPSPLSRLLAAASLACADGDAAGVDAVMDGVERLDHVEWLS